MVFGVFGKRFQASWVRLRGGRRQRDSIPRARPLPTLGVDPARLLLQFLLLWGGGSGLPPVAADDGTSTRPQPNILLVMADDLGIEGVGAYGSDSFKTPNIDRIAAEGIRFTRAFANPACTPTRTELLTGRYPFRTGTPRVIWDMERHQQYLDVSEPSFARQLQKAGYTTAIAGKWQVTFLARRDTVHDFGFDSYMLWQIQTAAGERTRRYHKPHYRHNGRVIADEIADRYGPDVLVDYLIDFMEADRDGPFMAYYAALLPHFPWVPTPASEDQSMPEDQRYGDPKFFPEMVARLDHNVGRLLNALEDLELARDTVVIFLTDNGTDQQLTARWKGREVAGGKASATDRGTRVPLAVRWPDRIAAGAVDEGLVEVADLLPTLCELAGAPLPEQTIDGRSFVDRLMGDPGEPKSWVHLELGNTRYLRSRNWIVTADGEYRKVRPYPIDAESVDPDGLAEAQLRTLRGLERRLKELRK